VKQHWNFLATLVENSHCTITAPDYPLAPDHTYADAFDMVTPIYKSILSKQGPSHTILMGDSAGGGFALALAQKMKCEHADQPDQIILLSPWLDITLKNPEIKNIDAMDSFLGVDGLQKAGKAYAGNADPNDYMLSPINGPLEGLGKISIFIGSRDILVADTRLLNVLARSRDITINYREYEDMLHVWMLMNFPESQKAKQEIIKLIMS
jgi:acetyl esterase/lipase